MGRSRRVLASVVVAVALAAAGGTGLTGCGDTSTPSHAAVQKALEASGFSERDAACVTDQLFAVLTKAQLRAVAAQGAAGVPESKSTALSEQLGRCAVAGSTTSTTIPPGTIPPVPTTLPRTTSTTR